MNNLGTIESYIGTFFSKEYVMKKVLRMTDNEIDEMQRQIKREEGLDPDEGGIDVPQNTDGITRYPSQWTVSITQMMLQNMTVKK